MPRKVQLTKRRFILLVLVSMTVGLFVCRRFAARCLTAGIQTFKGKATIRDRVEQYGPIVQDRLSGAFERTGVPWPGRQVLLIAFKEEKLLEVWVADKREQYHFLKAYPILKTSGRLGPKLKEGDRQVPEGLYHVESLNPNSRFHLSLRVNYPNDYDRTMAAREGRDHLGGDIMIHGGRVSIGCLAMGDPAAEDLFILAAAVGIENVSVIISPVDFRVREFEGDFSQMPRWVPDLYQQIKTELMKWPTPTNG